MYTRPKAEDMVYEIYSCCSILLADTCYRMDKARRFGWHGHVDSLEAMRRVLDDFVEFKMIPPLEHT